MRRAYLELLKLALCDLAGSGTVSVNWTEGGGLFSRDLTGESLKLRSGGLDWPLNGLTMVGLARLDDLQSCVETIVSDGVEGDMIEAGAWRGGASILIRAVLDSLGCDDRTLWVADSFQGFPSPDDEQFPQDQELDLSKLDYLAAPLEEVVQNFQRLGLEQGVRFVEGFFEDTLPRLRGGRWSLIRLDGDSYEATRIALESLYPGLAAGGYLIIDDYLLLDACRQAVDDFRSENDIHDPIEEIDWNGARWRRLDEPPPQEAELPEAEEIRGSSVRARPRDTPTHVPTMREHKLRHKLRTTRARLEAAVAELEALRQTRLSRLAEWRRSGTAR